MLKFLFAKPSEISLDQKWLDVPENAEVFTYHKKSAGRALLSGLILAAVSGATAIHVLLSMWNHWVAGVATHADYKDSGGIRTPKYAEAWWNAPEGRSIYWRGNVNEFHVLPT